LESNNEEQTEMANKQEENEFGQNARDTGGVSCFKKEGGG
jgi:hypothetical protein